MLIEEVEKFHRHVTTIKGNAIDINLAGLQLEYVVNPNNVLLSQVPMVLGCYGNFDVLGKSSPSNYLNGR